VSTLIKRFIFFALLMSSLFTGYFFYDRQFKLSNIKGNFPYVEVLERVEDLNELKNVFAQPFYFLDRGKQSYVFESQDKRYVVKFFDNRCLRSGKFSFFFSIKKKRCDKKLKLLFDGLQLASQLGPETTGLLFVQLIPDSRLGIHAQLIDRFGFTHDIDLATVPFAVQQKAIQLRSMITDLLNLGNVEEAVQHLDQVIDMYVEGYENGIVDLDHNFMYNTGFIGNRPIRIDVGRLKYDEKIKNKQYYLEDLHKVFIGRLEKWLDRHFPQYKNVVVQEIQAKLRKISD